MEHPTRTETTRVQAGEPDYAGPLLQVQDLKTHFFTRQGIAKAVDGATFSLDQGETLGLVGESGSGKTLTALSILGLVPQPGARIVGGQVLFQGADLVGLPERELRSFRGRRMSMILQDPATTLNPVFQIGEQVAEPLHIHRMFPRNRILSRVLDLLKAVRIPDPETRLRSYPHQLSGGMRQRVVGATALASEPMLLIADEPTTSLDVTIQAQYLALLQEIQEQSRVAMLFITHDMGIVANLCQRVAVMYSGRVVEQGSVHDIFHTPAHPYTTALLGSVPTVSGPRRRLTTIQGEPPNLYNLPQGCHFAPRCPSAMDICHRQYPPTVDLGTNQRSTACWLHAEEKHGADAPQAN